MAASVNNSGKAFNATSTSSINLTSFLIGGVNRVLYAFVGSGGAAPTSPATVKWNTSESLTQLGSTLTVSSFGRFSLWRLIAPSAVTATVAVDWGGVNQDEQLLVAVACQDVDQATPNGSVATATGTNTTPTVNATTVSGSLTLDGVFTLDTGGTSRTISVGANQTSLQEIEGANTTAECLGSSREIATGVSTTMSWSISGAVDAWGIFAFAVNGIAGDPSYGKLPPRAFRPRGFAPGRRR